MGTWGPEPFDSDTAADYLDDLGELSPPMRLDAIVRTLGSVPETPRETAPGDGVRRPADALPEEVIAAAAVVAANLPSGERLPWNGEVAGITEWLPQPVPEAVRSLAIGALDAAVPAGGWWWRSWVDDADRDRAAGALDRLRAALGGG